MTSLEALTALGLTEYAAKAYVALVALGEADAEAVAARSGVPRTKVYDALDELGSRGWAKDEGGRPRRWRPESPHDCVARERARLDALMAATLPDLESQFEKRAVRVVGTVWVLEGAAAIEQKLAEMVAGASKHVLLSVPAGEGLDESHLRILRAAARRDVRVQVMVADAAAVTPRVLAVPAEVRVTAVPGRIALVDQREALIVMPGGDHRAIWNPTPELVSLMGAMVVRLWSTGRPFSPAA